VVRRIGLDGELHHAGGERPHFELVEHLVVLLVLGRADVDDLPVESVVELLEALECDVEVDGGLEGGDGVIHHHVADVHFGHSQSQRNNLEVNY
jgi:hypothetical protein